MTILLIVGAVILLFCFIKFVKNRKKITLGSLTLVSGGVKNGKSTLCVYLAIKEYKKAKRGYKICETLSKIPGLKKLKYKEEPLLYSNVPLAGVSYVPVTEELLMRKKRFSYKSVIYIQEASLVAGSQMIKDIELNDRLLLFNKLIGHETRGGKLIYDTQNIGDCHYTIKRSVSQFYWLYPMKKIPFFCVIRCRELIHDEEKDVTNTFNEDIEETMLNVYVPKRTWKKFDAYCFSSLTDNLKVERNTRFIPARPTQRKKLKVNKLVSFNKKLGDIQKNDEENL